MQEAKRAKTDRRTGDCRSLPALCLVLLIGWAATGFTWPDSPFYKLPFREPPFRVLIFLDTDCPICQQTARRVQEMAVRCAGRVSFEAVYPTETVTQSEVAEFEKTYQLTIPHRLDPAHKLVKQYAVTTTPEVVLVTGRNRILYRGSVDNQFYRLGRSRPQPTEFYLNDALTAVLTNKPILVRQTTPTGCLINRN